MRTDVPRHRLFIDADLATGVEAAFNANQVHYLTTVLRMAPGDEVALFNGRSGEWRARITVAGRKSVSASVLDLLRPQAAEPDLWLCFAPIKHARIDTIAEKAGELGAAVLQPVITRHTNVARVNTARLAANAIEAAEQCERLTVPEVREPMPLARLIEGWPADRMLLFCDESGAGKAIASVLGGQSRDRTWAILTGPEGGFDVAERQLLHAMPNALPVSLGPRILRADTAAIAALAIWQSILGDWRG